ncbi:hypothetical protein [Neptuniibacter sp. QD37_11]|uniref:hypothetical protein n=1 Tax=Neptuniibacter sp. QD37_11 TaxID=3398209 RepID=UPI0039F4645A
MATYLGMTVEQMLYNLRKNCQEVRLTAGKNELCWTLYTLSDEKGEFKKEGSLFDVVRSAAKPFIGEWKAENGELKKALEPVLIQDFGPIAGPDSTPPNKASVIVLGSDYEDAKSSAYLPLRHDKELGWIKCPKTALLYGSTSPKVDASGIDPQAWIYVGNIDQLNLNFTKPDEGYPCELHPVITTVQGPEGAFVTILTMENGQWVTDSSVALHYDAEPLKPIPESHEVLKWAEFDDNLLRKGI